MPLTAGHEHDLPAMAAAVTDRTRLIFVCNPNNPTGTVVDGAALTRFLDEVPSDGLVVLDEAYREFVTDPAVVDGLSLLERYPNLIVLRTFSKAYGLAGMRVGYGIAADPAVAMAVRQTQTPFAVTSIAQAAALASLDEVAEKQLIERVAELVDEREPRAGRTKGGGLRRARIAGQLRMAGRGHGRPARSPRRRSRPAARNAASSCGPSPAQGCASPSAVGRRTTGSWLRRPN